MTPFNCRTLGCPNFTYEIFCKKCKEYITKPYDKNKKTTYEYLERQERKMTHLAFLTRTATSSKPLLG